MCDEGVLLAWEAPTQAPALLDEIVVIVFWGEQRGAQDQRLQMDYSGMDLGVMALSKLASAAN